jgi:hypothetical protein
MSVETVVEGVNNFVRVCVKLDVRKFLARFVTIVRAGVTSQHVGQLRGRIEGFCALHLKLWDFFTLFTLKPKKDRSLSSRGEVV